jgi:N-acetylglucosaminyldiphosphoundecaprenol N-acetyl-beta-D-mannosaminyltransferase
MSASRSPSGIRHDLAKRFSGRLPRTPKAASPATAEVVALLGIPIDNVTLEEAVDRILEMTRHFGKDGRPRLVATVNVDFLVNSLAWFSRTARHPELLDILRRADLVTADGMPLVWASRLLGTPLKERVTGADLVPALAAAAAGKGMRIYFLGGQGDTAERAAAMLATRYPDLLVAGVDAPYVHIDGQALADAARADAQVVARINRSGADVLFIGFGNPKQEVWFQRNRQRLRVPVSIGVGGTFAFITGDVTRAPLWMQRTGLEWIFRISQDPWRLWKRYGVGFFKFALMFFPTLAADRARRFRHRRRGEPAVMPENFGSGPGIPRTLIVPVAFDAAVVRQAFWVQLKEEAPQEPLVLDFAATNFIDSAGIGYLMVLWRRFETAGKPLWLYGPGPAVRRVLQTMRVLDLFAPRILAAGTRVPAADERGAAETRLTIAVNRQPDRVELHLTGILDAVEAARLTAEWAAKTVGDVHCIVYVDGLRFIDSAGLMVLLRLFKHTGRHDRRLVLCSPGPVVRRMLRVTRLDRMFVTVPNAASVDIWLEH